MKKHLLFSAFITLFLLNSCKQESKYAYEIQQLDELLVTLDKNEKKLQKIDLDKANVIFQTVESNLSIIQQHTSDSLRKEVGVLYHNYSAIKKGVRRARKHVPEFLNKIEYSKRQIDVLQQNLEIEKWETETVLSYLYDEEMAVIKIKQSVDAIIDGMEFSITRYDSLNPLITDVVNQLLAQDSIQ